jgi:hypothetical protein
MRHIGPKRAAQKSSGVSVLPNDDNDSNCQYRAIAEQSFGRRYDAHQIEKLFQYVCEPGHRFRGRLHQRAQIPQLGIQNQ